MKTVTLSKLTVSFFLFCIQGQNNSESQYYLSTDRKFTLDLNICLHLLLQLFFQFTLPFCNSPPPKKKKEIYETCIFQGKLCFCTSGLQPACYSQLDKIKKNILNFPNFLVIFLSFFTGAGLHMIHGLTSKIEEKIRLQLENAVKLGKQQKFS